MMRKRPPLGLYSRTVPRAMGGLAFLMSEVPLYTVGAQRFYRREEREVGRGGRVRRVACQRLRHESSYIPMYNGCTSLHV